MGSAKNAAVSRRPMDAPSLPRAARGYAERRGWPVFPLAAGSKSTLEGTHGFYDASAQAAVVQGLWELRGVACNIGLRTGAASGVIVIDVDPRHDGDATLAALEAQEGDLPDTLTAITPSRGLHLYFRHPGAGSYRVPNSASTLGAGLDVRGDGGYVVLPPSRRPDGAYKWLDEGVPVADLPAWLLGRVAVAVAGSEPGGVNGSGRSGTHTGAADGEPIPYRQRNTTLASLAGSMRRRGMTAAEIEAALRAVNAARCVPPLAEPEVAKIAQSVGRYTVPPAAADPQQQQQQQRLDDDSASASAEAADSQGAARGWRPTPQTMRDLFAKELPPVRWAVKDLLGEGVILLAAKPKTGKTVLMLNIAWSVAAGAPALGGLETERGEALYLALEDNERRMQKRIRQMLAGAGDGAQPPEGVSIVYEWPKLDLGGLAALERYLDEHPATRLVVIDTLEHIRPTRRAQQQGVYADDYGSVRGLQQLAGRRQIVIVVITHLRKAPAEDPFDEINASNGLLASVDNALVMRRNNGVMELHRRGRDYEDARALALASEAERLTWTCTGFAEDAERSRTRAAILDVLSAAAPDTLGPKEIAEAAKVTPGYTRVALTEMFKTGEVIRPAYGRYTIPANTANTANTSRASAGRKPTGTPPGSVSDAPATNTSTNTSTPLWDGAEGASVSSVSAVTGFVCARCGAPKSLRDDGSYAYTCDCPARVAGAATEEMETARGA